MGRKKGKKSGWALITPATKKIYIPWNESDESSDRAEAGWIEKGMWILKSAKVDLSIWEVLKWIVPLGRKAEEDRYSATGNIKKAFTETAPQHIRRIISETLQKHNQPFYSEYMRIPYSAGCLDKKYIDHIVKSKWGQERPKLSKEFLNEVKIWNDFLPEIDSFKERFESDVRFFEAHNGPIDDEEIKKILHKIWEDIMKDPRKWDTLCPLDKLSKEEEVELKIILKKETDKLIFSRDTSYLGR